ncbi:M67 family metallopeptidase [Sphingomonas qomolangmaensis]|uniref:M67 family metallopeptidase n=1 Tax=Sphingomonas qomolangmaensis TaxID=2918765 RepID=A0ABY5LDB3_9SPHN|nr:M67 family metallopeptidase [Sphingomonas qomolangmaensis]UUL83658.1 M67 family metallopeptidase [Sphingomonas qomolangmaensis]
MQRIDIASSALSFIGAAATRDPSVEACGLLLGMGAIARATEARNVAAEPARTFEIDPAALFAALRAERAGGERVIGYWHSHPSGDANPSATDAAMATPDGRIWLIAAKTEVSAWQAVARGTVHGRFDAVELVAIDDQRLLAT